jgi:glycosyltransferase involved in cell wall biosynthesis
MRPKATVIIATYNGAGKLSSLLDSLEPALQNVSAEIIVVVDGSTDNTMQVLKGYEEKLKFIVINEANRGRAGARNRGAAASSGEILIFYDDDLKIFPDSIKKHIGFHEKTRGLLCGNIIEDEETGRPEIQNYKAFLTKKWTTKYAPGITMLNEANLFFTAANCSMTKDIFVELNGFDGKLTDGEDHDLAHRALKSGLNIFFDKSNCVKHFDLVTCKSYIRRLRAYRKAHEKLQQLYPERYIKRELSIGKRLGYRLLAFSGWPALIDAGGCKFLPKKIRYRFYDLVIQALAIEHPDVKL